MKRPMLDTSEPCWLPLTYLNNFYLKYSFGSRLIYVPLCIYEWLSSVEGYFFENKLSFCSSVMWQGSIFSYCNWTLLSTLWGNSSHHDSQSINSLYFPSIQFIINMMPFVSPTISLTSILIRLKSIWYQRKPEGK